ncbi:reverse transcriptase domain-containing protein, partial [Tanacetum coccineum]
TIERLQQRIQQLELRQLQQDSPTEEAEPESNVWDDGPDDVNPFGGIKPRYRDDPIRSMGLKIEKPEFTGKVHPDDFIDWLSTVERVRRMEGKSKVETWEKMKKLMKAKFLPENHRQEAFLYYHNLSQRNMIVEEVINEFDKLRMRCDVVEEEEKVVAWFLGVLKPKIADICSRIGHYARDFLNLKTLAFVSDDVGPIYDTDAEPELDEPDDELVYPDRGEALVI